MTTVRAGHLDFEFSLVGPGRVGSSLARWLIQSGARPASFSGRTTASAAALSSEVGARAVPLRELHTATDDLLLICVDDGAVAEVAESLGDRPQAGIAIHVSGVVEVEALSPLREGGSAVGGLHPLRAFPAASHKVVDAAGTLFSVGGDPPAVEFAKAVVRTWDGRTARIEDGQRPLYHLAASLAAGGVVTLLATAAELAEQVGLEAGVVDGYHGLALQALRESGRQNEPAIAITGPVARGDHRVLETQLAALIDRDPEALEIVVALAQETVRQRATVGGSAQDHSKILSTLAKVMERKSFLDRQ